jgi:hypothetical protein
MGTYIALKEMFYSFMRDGQPKLEAATKLRYEARHADLLFPENDEVILFLNEIIEKSFDRAYAWADWEPLRGCAFAGEILSSNEVSKKEDSFKKMNEIDGWFIQQIENKRLKKVFEDHLRLPSSI